MPNASTTDLHEEVTKLGKADCVNRSQYVKSGDWRTLDWFWRVPSVTCYLLEDQVAPKLSYATASESLGRTAKNKN